MEISTEISKKIRAAIKGKLQELGAYVDEELPDYIMVMVANKKNAQQMAEDLSLFLGNNTLKFTVWLHGVLEKLRSVAVEPASVRSQHMCTDPSDSNIRVRVPPADDRLGEDLHGLDVSSSRSDSLEARVSTSFVHEHQVTKGRLTSTVKPLVELQSAEAIIDIKPEPDDDLITEELAEGVVRTSRPGLPVTHGSGRPSMELYRPPQAGRLPGAPARAQSRAQENLYVYRAAEQDCSRSLHQDNRSSRASLEQTAGSQAQDEGSRKRRAPMASSIIRVSRGDGVDSDELEEEEDEEEPYGARSRGLSSRVSLPSKPERRPSLPPAKQANKNLILKAISEAQESISRTTNYASAPQRQMVPVAPRTRLASEELSPVLQQAPDDLHNVAPQRQTQVPAETVSARQPVQIRSLSSRLQMDIPEQGGRGQQAFVASEVGGMKPRDTRSFIVRRRETDNSESVQNRLGATLDDVVASAPRTVQASRDHMESPACGSPKFIVTLDGVPSPLTEVMESDTDTGDKTVSQMDKWPKGSVHDRLQLELQCSDEDEQMDEDTGVLVKRQKVMERCKFWPVCKSGDKCMYHHPTAQCKIFPNCKFGDKCLFVHPNCKYDAKCTKADCPFTHVSRRGAAPPPRPTPQMSSSTCRFFPDCKKVDCPFYHPKACRFAAQCKRAGCPFYHPSLPVPPRHALKWTKASTS